MNDCYIGGLRKMRAVLKEGVNYCLPIGEQEIPMNERIGTRIKIKYTGEIYCIACARKTKTSFAQGYCFPCFKTLAACDLCIMRPETCHYHLGTCREPAWGDVNCMQDHVVYLANSSGLKVGITRATQIPTRWIDQGASQALGMFKVKNRLYSGLIEATLKQYIADKTNWRKLLTADAEKVDMEQNRDELLKHVTVSIEKLHRTHRDLNIDVLQNKAVEITFPVERYPEKIKSLNLDKTPEISGQLWGIKGQYLILDTGVINIRKYTGYQVKFY